MIIIGILAAIAIPTFLSQRKNGWNSASKTDLSNFGLAAESAAVDRAATSPPCSSPTRSTRREHQRCEADRQHARHVGVHRYEERQHRPGPPATTSGFCIVGHNTPSVPTDGFWTYCKAKGGLQPTVYTSALAAEGGC